MMINLTQKCLLDCSIDDFERTPELAIFDLLKIPLYHGWIFDTQVTSILILSVANICRFQHFGVVQTF